MIFLILKLFLHLEQCTCTQQFDNPIIKFKGENRKIKYILSKTGLFKLCGYTNPAVAKNSGKPITQGTGDEGLTEMTKFLISEAVLGKQLNSNDKPEAERLVNRAIGGGYAQCGVPCLSTH